MKQYQCIVFIGLLCVGSLFGVKIVFAETVPASKCITAATEATNAKALAQMEKDIAPYVKDAAAAKVIEEYKRYLETAWQAMQEPYCGYGAYGTASAIKSFTKSITRARAAFSENIKHPNKATVSLMKEAIVPVAASTDVDESQIATSSKAIVAKAVKISVKQAATSTKIYAGLRRGMKSESVKAMQKKLATYYQLSEDGLVTGYFGAKTESLIKQFQLKKKLISSASSTAAGLVGPKTAAALNALE